jgi:para-aminobenzoate synthetase component I
MRCCGPSATPRIGWTAHPTAPFHVRPGSHSTTVGGGWIGYLSYPDPGADGRSGRIPEAAGGWTDCVLRYDRDRQWWFESLSGAPMPDWLAEALTTPAPARAYRMDWDAADRQAHRAGVLACLEAIRAGEVYQACVCTQFAGTIAGEPLDFFIDGIARTAPARAAYIAGPWGAVASLSPELFLCRRGDLVISSPIKGTLPLYAPPSALRESSKDVAENVMIVDLVRNDLGRVAVTGSVTVPELLVVRPAPGVWHLVSTVSAQVPIELPTSALLDATFPPASITGTPKIRARELISQWEQSRRGVYCGTVGLASPVAGCELNVAIRTVEFDAAGNAVLGSGGGITADSDVDAEWEECLHKAAPIIGAGVASAARSQHRVVELTP